MPRKCVVTFAASAIRDMEDIRAWYADQEAGDVGARMVGEIVSRVERLSDFPESGRIVPEFGVVSLREIIYPGAQPDRASAGQSTEVGIRNAARPLCILTSDSRLLQHNSVT